MLGTWAQPTRPLDLPIAIVAAAWCCWCPSPFISGLRTSRRRSSGADWSELGSGRHGGWRRMRTTEARMTMLSGSRPHRGGGYYFLYINQVPAPTPSAASRPRRPKRPSFLRGISEEQSRHRYAPGKWTIRQVVSHINDTERLFVFRAFWFARGLPEPLPSFDQDIAIAHAAADERSLRSHIDEFRAVRGGHAEAVSGAAAGSVDEAGTASGTVHRPRPRLHRRRARRAPHGHPARQVPCPDGVAQAIPWREPSRGPFVSRSVHGSLADGRRETRDAQEGP